MLQEGAGKHVKNRTIPSQKYRFSSSNRSIKRRKFDDELVEYSLGVPGVSNIKVSKYIFLGNQKLIGLNLKEW